MTTDTQTPVRRDANGHWLPGHSANPSGRPAKVKEIEALAQEHSADAFARIVSLLDHRDAKVALAAANSILDRAFGKPGQSVRAEVQTLDIRKLWLDAVQMSSAKENAKTIEAEPMRTKIVEGRVVPIKDDAEPNTW